MLGSLLFFMRLGGGSAQTASTVYPWSLLAMRNDVKNTINQAYSTTMFQLGGGQGNPTQVVTPSDKTIDRNINEAIATFCTRCLPIEGTYTVNAFTGKTLAYADLTAGTQARIWAPLGVTWNGATLPHTNLTAIRNWGDVNATAAAPTYWREVGPGSVALWPAPTTPGTAVVTGLQLPALMVFDTDISPMPPNLNYAIVYLAAARCCEKQWTNPDLQARVTIWIDAAEKVIQARLLALWQTDRVLAQIFFEQPQPPTSPLTGAVAGEGQPQQGG